MKKLLILGGSRYVLPLIEIAHRLNAHVITCSNVPDEISHKYADEYYNVSVVDKEEVLKLAKEKSIDGIVSFACDPGVVTAAYVSEKMNLNFQGSYKSTSILQNKGLFRDFLIKNGFNSPRAKHYREGDDPFKDVDYFNWPVIVKPVDSAGSKGVTKVDNPNSLKDAISIAVNQSKSKNYIIEDFLIFKGYHSSTDVYTVDGKIKFITYSDQLFDSKANNPYAPAIIVWPSTMEKKHQDYLTSEIQRLMTLLDMKTGIYNIETCVDTDGNPYIMEVSPRGGGCKIAELQRFAFNVDLIEAEVRNALGLPMNEVKQTTCKGCWGEFVIHSQPNDTGIFKGVTIKECVKNNNLIMIELSKKEGEKVYPFTGANMALGDLFLKTNDREEMNELIDSIDDWLIVNIEKEKE